MMSSDTVTRGVQVCHSCGGSAALEAHFCPQCAKILGIGRAGDYFAFLGVPRQLGLDAADLERRFRALSRQFHPDYFYNAPPIERRASLERSSYLNDAYRTLKDPMTRIEYLIGLVAAPPATDRDAVAAGAAKVPPTLLEEVFTLNEELDAVREMRAAGAPDREWQARLAGARLPIEAKRADHEAQVETLSRQWDALADRDAAPDERRAVLDGLRDRMLERKYIANLLATIDRESSI